MTLIPDHLMQLLDEAIVASEETILDTQSAFQKDLLSLEEDPQASEAKKNALLSNKTIGTIDIPKTSCKPLFHYDKHSGRTSIALQPKDSINDIQPQVNMALALTDPKSIRKRETAGKAWFDMPAVEMTEELKRDLKLLQMRSVLDPKRFYKKDGSLLDSSKTKFLQMGTIMNSHLEPYNRMTRKERKNHIVQELLADEQQKAYLKRRFLDVQHHRRNDHVKNRYSRRHVKKGKK